jgi:hypothetical protein
VMLFIIGFWICTFSVSVCYCFQKIKVMLNEIADT